MATLVSLEGIVVKNGNRSEGVDLAMRAAHGDGTSFTPRERSAQDGRVCRPSNMTWRGLFFSLLFSFVPFLPALVCILFCVRHGSKADAEYD